MRNNRMGRRVYGVLMALGAFILVRSFVLQLFWPIDAIDRANPKVHHAFCTSHLLLLRTEFLESTRQDMALGLGAAKGFCVRDARRKLWQGRLAAVRERCADSPPHVPLGARLAALEEQTCRLFESAQELWEGEGRDLSTALDALRG